MSILIYDFTRALNITVMVFLSRFLGTQKAVVLCYMYYMDCAVQYIVYHIKGGSTTIPT